MSGEETKATEEDAIANESAMRAIKSLRPESLRKQLTERTGSLDSLLNSQHCPITTAIHSGSWRSMNVMTKTAGGSPERTGRLATAKNPKYSLGAATTPQHSKPMEKIEEPEETPPVANTGAAQEEKWCHSVFDAIRRDDAKLLKKKLAGQPDALQRLSLEGNSPLTVATTLPLKWEALMVLIEKLPGLCNINEPFEALQLQHRFLLHEAVARRDLLALEVLFKNGAQPDARLNDESTTALHLAAGNLHVGIVSSLLKNGADVSLADGDRCTPILHAVQANVKQKGSMSRTVEALMKASAGLSNYQLDTETALQTLRQTQARTQKSIGSAEALYEKHNKTPWAVSRTEREAHQSYLEKLRLTEREIQDTAFILQRYTRMAPNPGRGRW
jgi:hypothetical protein